MSKHSGAKADVKFWRTFERQSLQSCDVEFSAIVPTACDVTVRLMAQRGRESDGNRMNRARMTVSTVTSVISV